jgi:hypothetical protein
MAARAFTLEPLKSKRELNARKRKTGRIFIAI